MRNTLGLGIADSINCPTQIYLLGSFIHKVLRTEAERDYPLRHLDMRLIIGR